MKRRLQWVALLVACIGCASEHQCRDGTLFLTVQFVDRSDQVDGFRLRYRMDDKDPWTELTPPFSRPSNAAQGGLELRVTNYALHQGQSLILQYIPTENQIPIGGWRQEQRIPLKPGCSTGTLNVSKAAVEVGADSGAANEPLDGQTVDLAVGSDDLVAYEGSDGAEDRAVTADSDGSGGSGGTGGTGSRGTGGSADGGSGDTGQAGGVTGAGGSAGTMGGAGSGGTAGVAGTGGGAGTGGRGGTGGSSGSGGNTSQIVCGGVAGATCPASQFCDLASNCGKIAGAIGTCVPTGATTGCGGGSTPVCGCDGKTYTSDCDRVTAFVLKASDGLCGGATGGAGGTAGTGGGGGGGGGSSGSGGTSDASMDAPLGGAGGTGGASASGGAPTTGGASATGGDTASGGVPAAGGTSTAGGAPTTGGTTTTGGTIGTGGAPGTGGTSTTGGSGGGCPSGMGPSMVRLPGGYCIDATEVTRGQYKAWLGTGPTIDSSVVECSSWKTTLNPPCSLITEDAQLPAACVDWCDAYLYCRAAGKRLCGQIGGTSNPYSDYAISTSQWYVACTSGGAANTYPYGSSYDASKCNGYAYNSGIPIHVGSAAGCQSNASGYQGVFDLSGNMWEWEDSCNGPGQTDQCRLRGGSFTGSTSALACGYAYNGYRNANYNSVGFRCCSAN